VSTDAVRTASTGRLATAAALPPWMLLWLLAAAFSVPGAMQGWRQYFLELTGGGTYGTDAVTSPSCGLLRLLALLQLVPSVVIVVGLLSVTFPQLRTAVVERRLGPTEQRRPVIAEIEDFLREHGADVEVHCNLVRQDRMARIYPTGWRRARLAVFGPLVALWRRDRPAAHPVLLHEVAHTRTGDHLFLGLGSPFVALVNLWFPLLTVFGVLPVWATSRTAQRARHLEPCRGSLPALAHPPLTPATRAAAVGDPRRIPPGRGAGVMAAAGPGPAAGDPGERRPRLLSWPTGLGTRHHEPFNRLPGDLCDHLEVFAQVQDREPGEFGGGGDKEIGYRRSTVLSTAGERGEHHDGTILNRRSQVLDWHG
jgi:hypothetical protein